jgi:hypothetical protein
MYIKALILATTLAFSVNAVAFSGEKGESEKRHGNRLEKLTKKLGLNDDQQAKLKVILKEHHVKHKALKEDLQQQLQTILTTEQIKKMEAMKKQHHEMRRKHKSKIN